LYLVCSDLNLTDDQITAIYQKRWNTVKTQSNHIFASIYAAFKLEILKIKHHTNHFALKSKLYLKALQASFLELQNLRASHQLP